MPELSDSQYDRLMKRSSLYEKLKERYGNLEAQHRTLRDSHTEVTDAYEVLHGESEQLRQQAAASPIDADSRVATLSSQLKQLKTKQAFSKLAKGKVRDEAVDDLVQLSGYSPEGDDPDEAAISSLIESQLVARPYFRVDSTTAPAPAVAPKPGAPVKLAGSSVTAAEGSSRGGSSPPTPSTAEKVSNAYAATGRRSDVPGRI
jgi:hypothetical protein